MLFDSHIHVFPEKLKGKVFSKLSSVSGEPYYRGETIGEALEHNKEMGVTHSLVLHIATNPKQQQAVNDFAASIQTNHVLCFGSVHPKAEERIEELYRIKELGLKGVKLHPDYQHCLSMNDCMMPIYETCEKLGLVVAFHTGLDPYSPDVIHNPPKSIREIATRYQNLTIIAAHAGGMGMFEEAKKEVAGLRNVYIDTAMCNVHLTSAQLEEMIRLHGCDRVLFGSDSPWSTVEMQKAVIEGCNLTEEEKQQIYYKNAFELFTII